MFLGSINIRFSSDWRFWPLFFQICVSVPFGLSFFGGDSYYMFDVIPQVFETVLIFPIFFFFSLLFRLNNFFF